MMALGMRAHYRRGGCGLPGIILILYITILWVLLVLDLTTKWIAGFFLMTFLANFLNYFGLVVIWRNLPTTEGEALRQRTNVYFWVMNGLYLFVALSAAFWLRPKCT